MRAFSGGRNIVLQDDNASDLFDATRRGLIMERLPTYVGLQPSEQGRSGHGVGWF